MRWTALALLLVTVPATADRLYFKHGDYVDVDSWREDGDQILYKRFGGEIGVPKADVSRIERAASDPTNWQAPGSSKNASPPDTAAPPPAASPPGSGTVATPAAPPSGETWTPEPRPVVPGPPAQNAGKEILANYWEGQKQVALSQMDYLANAKRSCPSRYRTPRVIQLCQDNAEDLRRFWNERYIVATREHERYR